MLATLVVGATTLCVDNTVQPHATVQPHVYAVGNDNCHCAMQMTVTTYHVAAVDYQWLLQVAGSAGRHRGPKEWCVFAFVWCWSGAMGGGVWVSGWVVGGQGGRD